MLLLGSRLLNIPVMSLQTGTQLALAIRPVIDPSNLRILAYEVDGPLLSERPAFIRTEEIREYGKLGFIINGNDELVGLDDIVRLRSIYELNFPLIGLQVIDEHKRKLGKVDDYTLETGNFLIQQISVRRGFIKGITDTGLLIHRSQIIEINDSTIVVKAPSVKSNEPVMNAVRGEFVNPFRSNPQTAPE